MSGMTESVHEIEIDWSLMVILDADFLHGRPISNLAEAVIQGGATIIQLRNKMGEGHDFFQQALDVRSVTRASGIPLIINDRVDIALAVDADGIHVGQTDLPVGAVRKLVGNRIIGGSVHSIPELETMREADYLGVGAIFPTTTKDNVHISGPELIRAIRTLTRQPIVAIGGLTAENCASAIHAGADGVAVISAVLNADDPAAAAREIAEVVSEVKSGF